MRRCWWITILLLIFVQGGLAAATELRLNHQDSGSLIRLSRDSVAVIEMNTNPSTGYVWEADLPENGRLQILGRQFVPSNPGLLGSDGVEKIYVAGARKGQATLKFALNRRNGPYRALKKMSFNFESEGKLQRIFKMPAPDLSSGVQSYLQADASAAMLDAQSDSSSIGLPRSFNWCNQNGCTPVKNQGNCGSCWAFSTVSVFESLIKIKDGRTVDLSEQYLVSCNSDGYGCNGGWWAHDYHQWKTVSGEHDAGGVAESVKPYKARDTSCNPPNKKLAKIDNWGYVGPRNGVPSTNAIKQAIVDYGPVAAAVCVNNSFSYYSGGIFKGPSCSSVNHGINLVGWNDDGGYWILRNSWGRSWGENGYMRIKYGISNVGFGASYVRYDGGSDVPDPDPPDGDPDDPTDEDQLVVLEAENFKNNIQTNSHYWLEVSAPRGYSGQGAMKASPDSGLNVKRNYTTDSPGLEYAVKFKNKGRYYIWVRGYAADSGNSLHAGVNGKGVSSARAINFSKKRAWTWSNSAGRGPAYLQVKKAGRRTINIWMREDGFILDKIILTTSKSFVPR